MDKRNEILQEMIIDRIKYSHNKILLPRISIKCENHTGGITAQILCQLMYGFVGQSESPFFFFFFYLVCEAIGTAATPNLLCQPRVIVEMIVEKQMECRLAGETEVLGENPPQRHFYPSQNLT
jgi:hypothetical protein